MAFGPVRHIPIYLQYVCNISTIGVCIYREITWENQLQHILVSNWWLRVYTSRDHHEFGWSESQLEIGNGTILGPTCANCTSNDRNHQGITGIVFFVSVSWCFMMLSNISWYPTSLICPHYVCASIHLHLFEMYVAEIGSKITSHENSVSVGHFQYDIIVLLSRKLWPNTCPLRWQVLWIWCVDTYMNHISMRIIIII